MRRVNGFDEFYSRVKSSGWGEYIELMVDRSRNPTIDYPHVHIIHHASGVIEVVASGGPAFHPWRRELRDAGGQEVERAVGEAWRSLQEFHLNVVSDDGRAITQLNLIGNDRAGYLCIGVSDGHRSSWTVCTCSNRSGDSSYEIAVGQVYSRAELTGTHWHKSQNR